MARDLTDAWAAMSEASGSSSRQDKTLPAAKPKPAIPERTGAALPSTGGSGSIAGPLTETAYADRTYWADQTIASSDGLLSFKVKPIKSVQFLDANSSLLVVNYKQPT